jgi:hypothetical protein
MSNQDETIDITVNSRGTVKKVSFKIFDYLLNRGKLAAITVYSGNAVAHTEWFVKSVVY